MSTKGRHRMTLVESLKRRAAARRALARARLDLARQNRDLRVLAQVLVAMNEERRYS